MRTALRHAFLEKENLQEETLVPLPMDASKRCYFRLPKMLLMDAPPPHENTISFQVMAELLSDAGLSVPQIYASNHEHGFLLVEDLGELTFRKALEQGHSEALLYEEVIKSLVHLHQKVTAKGSWVKEKSNPSSVIPSPHRGRRNPESQRLNWPTLPTYDLDLFLKEAELFIDWYDIPLSSQAKEDFKGLWTEAYHRQPIVPHSIVMRDVMVDNLIWLPSRTGFKRCGFIDFQDGVWGPITYDLASLLEDARRNITPQFGQDMIELYLKEFPELDPQDFWESYTLWGAQRCTKIRGIFSRLSKRDGKHQYLTHLPRVKKILEHNLNHPSLKELRNWFQGVGL